MQPREDADPRAGWREMLQQFRKERIFTSNEMQSQVVSATK